MIIFDLDGTLADCEHRRNFVDPAKNPDYEQVYIGEGNPHADRLYNRDMPIGKPVWRSKTSKKEWKPDWQAFYEACDKDLPIRPSIDVFNSINPYVREVAIWSGRCESVRQKTEEWLIEHVFKGNFMTLEHIELKMRPIGDSTPDDELKERWLDETYEVTKWGSIHPIDFVFDDRPKVVRMWRSRGIFVFNCCQHNEEF
jgi:hypothetical protein